jgi:hypothetical protein
MTQAAVMMPAVTLVVAGGKKKGIPQGWGLIQKGMMMERRRRMVALAVVWGMLPWGSPVQGLLPTRQQVAAAPG